MPLYSPQVDNPWFPLPPGRVLHYRGESDGHRGREVFGVLHRTQVVDGVRTTVVHDRVFLEGRLRENTFDYYAQDRRGAVWYFGEDTTELDRHGRVTSREGSWRAGRQGARPGIFMPAHPRVGQAFQQEFFPGHAEDHFRIVRLRGRTLTTREWSPLEPGVRDRKVYRRGIGTVLELTLKGGNERWKLVG